MELVSFYLSSYNNVGTSSMTLIEKIKDGRVEDCVWRERIFDSAPSAQRIINLDLYIEISSVHSCFSWWRVLHQMEWSRFHPSRGKHDA